jgi:hypothetical protein
LVITRASHARGHEFDPRSEYVFGFPVDIRDQLNTFCLDVRYTMPKIFLFSGFLIRIGVTVFSMSAGDLHPIREGLGIFNLSVGG